MYLPECYETMSAEEQAAFLADELLAVCVEGVPVPWTGPHYEGLCAANIIRRILTLHGREKSAAPFRPECWVDVPGRECPF